jgi:hypothetical protein
MEHVSMSDNNTHNVPFESEDQSEQKLWSELAAMPRQAPSDDMRRDFYRELDRASTSSWAERVRTWLGLSGNAGWLTATACLLFGVFAGFSLDTAVTEDTSRMESLEQNVALLNRELILDRLEDATAGKRLRGVIDAGYVVEDDAEVARALLTRATEDSVQSVRTAAIDALGPRVSSAAVANELMRLLENAESPLVQLALVDMVLRHGSTSQLEQLLELAERDALHPDLVRHVKHSLGSESV